METLVALVQSLRSNFRTVDLEVAKSQIDQAAKGLTLDQLNSVLNQLGFSTRERTKKAAVAEIFRSVYDLVQTMHRTNF